MEAPDTRYARSGGAYIAYRIVGSGPVDLVLLQGGFSHVELQLEEPSFARFLGRLASFSRLIVLDVRGTGLSDRTMHLPTLGNRSMTFWRCSTRRAVSVPRCSAWVRAEYWPACSRRHTPTGPPPWSSSVPAPGLSGPRGTRGAGRLRSLRGCCGLPKKDGAT